MRNAIRWPAEAVRVLDTCEKWGPVAAFQTRMVGELLQQRQVAMPLFLLKEALEFMLRSRSSRSNDTKIHTPKEKEKKEGEKQCDHQYYYNRADRASASCEALSPHDNTHSLHENGLLESGEGGNAFQRFLHSLAGVSDRSGVWKDGRNLLSLLTETRDYTDGDGWFTRTAHSGVLAPPPPAPSYVCKLHPNIINKNNGFSGPTGLTAQGKKRKGNGGGGGQTKPAERSEEWDNNGIGEKKKVKVKENERRIGKRGERVYGYPFYGERPVQFQLGILALEKEVINFISKKKDVFNPNRLLYSWERNVRIGWKPHSETERQSNRCAAHLHIERQERKTKCMERGENRLKPNVRLQTPLINPFGNRSRMSNNPSSVPVLGAASGGR
eukprot:gene9456-6638_t